MVAVDTNVVVRFLVRDDEEQFTKACRLFEKQLLYISDSVVLESEWVLRYAYQFSPVEIVGALKKLFGLPNVHLAKASLVAQVLDWHLGGLDFTDAFHLAYSQNYERLYTFDKRFISQSKQLSGCVVLEP